MIWNLSQGSNVWGYSENIWRWIIQSCKLTIHSRGNRLDHIKEINIEEGDISNQWGK